MLILGIETSCDETGVALYDTQQGLLGHRIHSQVAMHAHYGGVVPELASRDHIRQVLPLTHALLGEHSLVFKDLDGVAYTQGPGLAGALLVGASVANGLAWSLNIPAIGIHHLEGHLLSPLLATPAPTFPFIALLVSGGHTQIMQVTRIGEYQLLGETVDDAAGEAFDKTAQLLGLGYPGGPLIAELAQRGRPGHFQLPRPMINNGNLNFSFSGLKTAVLTLVRGKTLSAEDKANVAAEFQAAAIDVLVAKSLSALESTRMQQLVVAGGVGANAHLRQRLDKAAKEKRFQVFYPPLALCTDNGAMIALAGGLRLAAKSTSNPTLQARPVSHAFTVMPRWDLQALPTI